MIPDKNIQHEGTLDVGGEKFSFDEDSLGFLMSVLTDLYSDPELAVIREYSTNARDAMIEAGKADQPIRISCPSALEPTFVVRDEGIGLSADEVIANLTKYGYSTKRDTNEATGMLGLGSKSALTYTSQFSYVTCKDGVTSTLLVTRQEDGVPIMQLVNQMDTPEAVNSVEVHIPVKNVDGFNQRVQSFFYTWQRGTVLIDDIEPKSLFGIDNDEAERQDDESALRALTWLDPDGICLVRRQDGNRFGRGYAYSYDAKLFIVSGGVSYSVSAQDMLDACEEHGIRTDNDNTNMMSALGGYDIYCFVDIGMVNFTPNREQVMMTARTKELLAELSLYVADRIHPAIDTRLQSMPTYPKALSWGRSNQQILRWLFASNRMVTWRGHPLKFSYSVPSNEEITRIHPTGTSYDNDRATRSYDWSLNETCVAIVHGFRRDSVPSPVKEAIRKRIKEEGLYSDTSYYTRDYVALVDRPVPANVLEMLGDPPQWELSDIWVPATRGPRKSSSADETRYRMVGETDKGWEDVSPGLYQPHMYIPITEFKGKERIEFLQELRACGWRIAVVWKRNADWFTENHPDVPTWDKWLEWYQLEEVPRICAESGPVAYHMISHSYAGRRECGDNCQILTESARRLRRDGVEQLPPGTVRDDLMLRIEAAHGDKFMSAKKMIATVGALKRHYMQHEKFNGMGYYAPRRCTRVGVHPMLRIFHDAWRMRSFSNLDMDYMLNMLITDLTPGPPSTDLVPFKCASNPQFSWPIHPPLKFQHNNKEVAL